MIGKKFKGTKMQHIFFILFFFCSSSLAASHIYAFIGADTKSSVGPSCRQDRDRMADALETIADLTDFELKLTTYSGYKLSSKALSKWLKDIHPGRDDVVFFYYSGHGNRIKADNTRWPAMYFSYQKEHVALTKVIDALKHKNARLSIILCDCCNDLPKGRKLTPKYTVVLPNFDVVQKAQGLESLFVDIKGTIIASASSPGGLAWNTSKGGIFTNAFLYCLQHEMQRSSPSWKRIFDQTYTLCESLQKPQVKLSIKDA